MSFIFYKIYISNIVDKNKKKNKSLAKLLFKKDLHIVWTESKYD